jgi:hypothetical protein
VSYRSDPAFFHHAHTHGLIETLAKTESLTLFVGAGISRDRGSPGWEDLVIQLLNEQLPRINHDISGKRPEKVLAGTRVFTQTVSPVVAASAVRQLYQELHPRVDERALMQLIAQDIHKHLYPGGKWVPGGPLAEAVVRLAVFWKSLGMDVAILTTNYDSNIECFAGDSEARQIAKDKGIKLQPRVDDKLLSSDVLPVYHLHGYIPFDGKARGNLAFSESGLALGTEVIGKTAPVGVDWRTSVLERRLKSSVTLFLGTTLRDRSVADSLIRTRAASFARYGLLSYQGDEWADQDGDIRAVADAALRGRMKHLHVEPIRPDYYGQVGQLLSEVIHCRINCDCGYAGDANAKNRYGSRLEQWWHDWHQMVTSAPDITLMYDRSQELLAEVREFAVKTLKSARPEELKVELWVRYEPKRRRELQLWSSSQAATRPGQVAHRCRIENRSNYAAVRAFCQGFAVRGPLLHGSGRWKSYFSVPIILRSEPWHNLPVGVVNLISTVQEDRTCLKALNDPEVWGRLFERLSGVGTAILDPTSGALTR